jgi:DNA-binding transcriptional MerR regulator
VIERPTRELHAPGYSDVHVKMGLTSDKLRIGSFAELAGTTPRTIRYYEEIGLLPCPSQRGHGEHRCYTPADVDRVKEIVRLRDLLGVPLEQLGRLLAAEDPPAELLALVRARRRQLGDLERELTAPGSDA